MLSYLDRFVKEIRGPFDVMRIFANLTAGQQHQLNRGMKAWFKYLEVTGQASEEFLNQLRKAVPKDNMGVDVNVPSEEDVVQSLRLMAKLSPSYNALYNLTLDSGLRLVEAVRFMDNRADAEKCAEFYVVALGCFRRTKIAYYGFCTDYTMRLVQGVKEKVNDRNASGYLSNHNRKVVAWKYLRKFAFDAMTSERLNIPESVADFIQGRTPKSIGARHYMKLKRKAIQFYPRYAEYVTELRRKAGLLTA